MRTEELLRPYNPWWEDVAQAFSRLPELLKIFYISLLEYPGREINYQRLSQASVLTAL